MFSELPKLFDRNFAIAYFLPVTIFLVANFGLLKATGYWSIVDQILTGNTLFDTTLAVFTAWVMGILLLVLNREIYRLLEGYGKYNPLRIYERQAKEQYNDKVKRLEKLNQEYYTENFSTDLKNERIHLMEELAQRYPDQEKLVLPTTFGNVLRAFEVYPRVMYGFEGIDGWSRILAVLPKEYRELIDDAKAQVDWWVNLSVLSFAFLIEFWASVFYKWGSGLTWYYIALNVDVPLAIFVLLNMIFSWRATSAAIGWGDYVKSAFDLFRFKLLESLGIDIPKTRKKEREIWNKYSQSILYRLPENLPALKKSTKRAKPSRTKVRK